MKKLSLLRWTLMASCASLLFGSVHAQNSEPGRRSLPLAQESSATSPATRTLALEGFVVRPDGTFAERSVVVSSAGGRAVSDTSGYFQLELEVSLDAEAVQVTAVGRAGRNLIASRRIEIAEESEELWVGALELEQANSCSPSWIPTFGGEPGVNGDVSALAVFDDGSGPALFVGAEFTEAGGIPASRVAKWDGVEWTALGTGLDDAVLSLAVYDAGGGDALYAGGDFALAGGLAANRIARWNGSSWSTVGSGFDATVRALFAFDDGSGSKLFAGGDFTTAGGGIASWDGATWASVGGGINGSVRAFTEYDDGNGARLLVAGDFSTAGGNFANRIARWNGSTWSTLGFGFDAPVNALAVYDDGSGPALFAGGSFTVAGTAAAIQIAKWDGAAWSGLSQGAFNGVNAPVDALAAFDDGSGTKLFVAGRFTKAAFNSIYGIAKWDGSAWEETETGANADIRALIEFDDGSGPSLFAGSPLISADFFARGVQKWNGSEWGFVGHGLNSTVSTLGVRNDSEPSELVVGGSFVTAGGERTVGIASWDGSNFSSDLSASLVPGLYVPGDLKNFDDGSGAALYAAGSAKYVFELVGTTWIQVPGEFDKPGGGNVDSLEVFDDGSGDALFAGGDFTRIDTGEFDHVAKWNGSTWKRLGPGTNARVGALAVYDDGTGAALYVAGTFTIAGGQPASRIARWDGSSWAALGAGLDAEVLALATYDDGTGTALYASGRFTNAGGAPAAHIAKWDGTTWTTVGGGLNSDARALQVFDDGGGSQLYAGGLFTTAGGLATNYIARWNGSSWSSVGSGMDSRVEAFTIFDDGTGSSLYAGGNLVSLDSADANLARWGCADSTAPQIDCPASVLQIDRAPNGPGENVSFVVTATDDLDPAPVVVCEPASGSYFAPGATSVTCTATDAAGNRSTCVFTVTVQTKALGKAKIDFGQ